MNQSGNYSFWLPEDSDPVKVSDLSENFAQIDTLIKNTAARIPAYPLKFVTGSYTGNSNSGTNNARTISTGITLVLVICSARVTSYNGSTMSYSRGGPIIAGVGFGGYMNNMQNNAPRGPVLTISGTTFTVSNVMDTVSLNYSGYSYNYLAIGY